MGGRGGGMERRLELLEDLVEEERESWIHVAAPRLNYALRTSPLYMCISSLQNIDNIVRTTATKCINVDLSGACWNQASLPIRLGGLGYAVWLFCHYPATLPP